MAEVSVLDISTFGECKPVQLIWNLFYSFD